MKPLLLLAAASLIPLAACTSNTKAPRAALDCPATQGGLTRTSAAADGKSCIYASADGAEVTLRLIPVSGSPYAALDQLENTLLAEADAQTEAGAKTLATADTRPTTASVADARRAAEEASKDAAGAEVLADSPPDDGVDIHMKDGQVVVDEGGGTTRVSLPGIDIEADEGQDSARIRIGPLHVDASGEEAVIRVRRDVRLKGEALSREKRGIRATFISEGKSLPEGAQFLGYEAGGPKRGPLAVAIVRANEELHDDGDIYRDVKRLVRKNGGV